MSPSQPTYRVCIIGTGRMGGLTEDEPHSATFPRPYSHIAAYQSLEQCEVVAVANRGAERMERFAKRFGIPAEKTYLDYREMIEREKPDIVSVTTPTLARTEPIVFCAEHGVRAIYAEKGLAPSLEESDRIAAAVKKHNVAFNWGAMRRHHSGFKQLAEAIAAGEIGAPKLASFYAFTDLITHHPHTLDTVSMLLGDPVPEWVEGRLVEEADAAAHGVRRPLPTYDPAQKRFIPAEGEVYASPYPSFFRVGYKGGTQAAFFPYGRFDVDVIGTEGRAASWNNAQFFSTWRAAKPVKGAAAEPPPQERTYTPSGESATVATIRSLIRELETSAGKPHGGDSADEGVRRTRAAGERTTGNIDVTMQSVEVQFGLVESHLQNGARVTLPIANRTTYIPGR